MKKWGRFFTSSDQQKIEGNYYLCLHVKENWVYFRDRTEAFRLNLMDNFPKDYAEKPGDCIPPIAHHLGISPMGLRRIITTDPEFRNITFVYARLFFSPDGPLGAFPEGEIKCELE